MTDAALRPREAAVLTGLFIGYLLFAGLTRGPISSLPLLLGLWVLVRARPPLQSLLGTYARPALMLLGALVLGVVASRLPDRSLKGIYDLLRGAVLFVPALYLVRYHRDLLWRALFGGTVLATLFWLGLLSVQHHRGTDLVGLWFGNLNDAGTLLGVLFVLTLWQSLFLAQTRSSGLGLAALALGVFALAAINGSRGSLLAMVLAALLLSVWWLPARGRWLALLLGLGLVLVGGGLLWQGERLPAWVWLHRGQSTFDTRWELYGASLQTWWKQAPGLGFGINTFKYLDYGQVFSRTLTKPHSIYLEVLISQGLVGAALWIAGLGDWLRRALARVQVRDPALILGAGLLIFLLLRGAVDMKWFGVYYPALVFAALGLVAGAARQGDLGRGH